MAGNPKDSKWFSVPRAARKSPKIEVTLNAALLAAVDDARGETTRSAVVAEALQMWLEKKESAE